MYNTKNETNKRAYIYTYIYIYIYKNNSEKIDERYIFLYIYIHTYIHIYIYVCRKPMNVYVFSNWGVVQTSFLFLLPTK